jgi:hypothetical protein
MRLMDVLIRSREPVERDGSAIEDVWYIDPGQDGIARLELTEAVDGSLRHPADCPERGRAEAQVERVAARLRYWLAEQDSADVGRHEKGLAGNREAIIYSIRRQ